LPVSRQSAEDLGDNRYKILDEAPDDPVWEFGKGDVVRCRIQKLGKSTTFHDALVAFEAAE